MCVTRVYCRPTTKLNFRDLDLENVKGACCDYKMLFMTEIYIFFEFSFDSHFEFVNYSCVSVAKWFHIRMLISVYINLAIISPTK